MGSVPFRGSGVVVDSVPFRGSGVVVDSVPFRGSVVVVNSVPFRGSGVVVDSIPSGGSGVVVGSVPFGGSEVAEIAGTSLDSVLSMASPWISFVILPCCLNSCRKAISFSMLSLVSYLLQLVSKYLQSSLVHLHTTFTLPSGSLYGPQSTPSSLLYKQSTLSSSFR